MKMRFTSITRGRPDTAAIRHCALPLASSLSVRSVLPPPNLCLQFGRYLMVALCSAEPVYKVERHWLSGLLADQHKAGDDHDAYC